MSTASSRPTRKAGTPLHSGPMCVVNIGAHLSLALPMESGLLLVRLLSTAMIVERDFHSKEKHFFEREQIGPTELEIIKAGQVAPLLAKPAPKESGVTPC